MWVLGVGTQGFQPACTQSAMAQSHYSACYWALFRCGRISRPQPAQLPLRGRLRRFLIFQGARLGGYPTPTTTTTSYTHHGHCPRTPSPARCLSSISSLLLLPPPSPSLSLPLNHSVSPSPCHGHCFLSGRRSSSLSSPLSAPAPELPIHLLRMPYSPAMSPGTRCNYNLCISKCSGYKRKWPLSNAARSIHPPKASFCLAFKRQTVFCCCILFFKAT